MYTILFYKYSENELKQLLDTLVVLIVTREKVNQHILDYFDKQTIPYKFRKLEVGDFSCLIPKNEEMGILRDLFIPAAIERKNSVNELVASIKERTRFENELIRSKGLSQFKLLVEDPHGYENIIRGKYRSQYNPKSLLASLKSFESRYNFTTVFLCKDLTGNYIFHDLYYCARNLLKK